MSFITKSVSSVFRSVRHYVVMFILIAAGLSTLAACGSDSLDPAKSAASSTVKVVSDWSAAPESDRSITTIHRIIQVEGGTCVLESRTQTYGVYSTTVVACPTPQTTPEPSVK